MSVCLRKFACLTAVVIMSSCTPPSYINEPTTTYNSSLLTIISPDSINAAAEIMFRIQKKLYTGNLVVKLKDTVFFDARIYSSLGIEVASVRRDSQFVMLEYNDRSYAFSVKNAMDSMPFIWARAIALKEFQSFFAGNLTPLRQFLGSNPDTTMVLNRHMMLLQWDIADRNLQLEMIINRKNSEPVQINLSDLSANPMWSIVFKNFREGRAYSLLFKEDDNNYFSIKYDKLIFFNGTNLL
jgi:hypothetical protein